MLFAAVIHATWNAMLRSGTDRFWTMTVMCAVSGVIGLVMVGLLPLPLAPSWPYILLSGSLHLGYYLFLLLAYRQSGLGTVYPIARGSSPLLVTIGAAIFAGEHLSVLAMTGIALVSFGVISLAFRGQQKVELSRGTLGAALATGVFIACYSVIDGIGVRLAGNAPSYTAWLFLMDGVTMPIAFVLIRGFTSPGVAWSETVKAGLGGAVSVLGYGVIIWAVSLNAMGPVSALRETSVVFAALIGRAFLNETLTLRRFAACIVIATGAICLGYR